MKAYENEIRSIIAEHGVIYYDMDVQDSSIEFDGWDEDAAKLVAPLARLGYDVNRLRYYPGIIVIRKGER